MAYRVTANIYSEEAGDYIEHYEGGEFEDYDEAYEFWDNWWPDMEDVRRVTREDAEEHPGNHYELEIGLWDEDGYDVEFYNEGIAI